MVADRVFGEAIGAGSAAASAQYVISVPLQLGTQQIGLAVQQQSSLLQGINNKVTTLKREARYRTLQTQNQGPSPNQVCFSLEWEWRSAAIPAGASLIHFLRDLANLGGVLVSNADIGTIVVDTWRAGQSGRGGQPFGGARSLGQGVGECVPARRPRGVRHDGPPVQGPSL